MNPWPFVIAAYGITGIGTLALAILSFAAMRKAERAVEELRRR
jgi:hypothetical protein